jgi:phosphoenolpyruvate carboxylase
MRREAEDARLRRYPPAGRILGDTVRDQEGADVFDLVERIRQTSIRFHRDEDKPARRELEAILDSMSTADTCGSSAPSAISRISPTSPRTRTTSARCGASRRRSRAGHAGRRRWPMPSGRLQRRRPAQILCEAQVSPVLTAHPTEVRRKSTMDREMEIAALLDRRERMKLTPEEADASDEQLRRAVLTLWQTNLLRRTKLTVLDEVANGLSFYDYTFLHEVPRLHCALEDQLNQEEEASGEVASFLTMGKLDRRRPRRQPVRDRRRHCAARCGCSRAG